jgi:hypothetical protein
VSVEAQSAIPLKESSLNEQRTPFQQLSSSVVMQNLTSGYLGIGYLLLSNFLNNSLPRKSTSDLIPLFLLSGISSQYIKETGCLNTILGKENIGCICSSVDNFNSGAYILAKELNQDAD